jgi:hypothetical protein
MSTGESQENRDKNDTVGSAETKLPIISRCCVVSFWFPFFSPKKLSPCNTALSSIIFTLYSSYGFCQSSTSTMTPPPGKLTPTSSPSDNERSGLRRLPLSSIMLMDLPCYSGTSAELRRQAPRDLTSIIDQAIEIAESTITRNEDGSVSLSHPRSSARHGSASRGAAGKDDLQQQ